MKLLRNTLLETFVTVVECGGFSDAQFALGVTQSAISIRIRDLEEVLGYRVCERGRGGFRLTERGEIAYRKACDILRSARDFDADLLELRDAVTGDLRIGIVDAISSLPGVDMSGAFQRFLSHPNEVRMEIIVASPTDLTQRLISGDLHVAIAPFRNKVNELSYTELCIEEHRLYCSRSHSLFHLPEDQITDQVLIRHPTCRLSYDQTMMQKLGPSDAGAVAANMEAMALLIESGHYIGGLPTHFAQHWVEKKLFRELCSPDLRWNSVFYLATRRTQVSRRAVELFVQSVCANR